MGKKGSWFAAIKKVFTPRSKGKQDSDNKNTKEKKKGLGKKLRHGHTNSFIPLFREPSNIEKIFGDFERELVNKASNTSRATQNVAFCPSLKLPLPKAASSQNVHHHKELDKTKTYFK